MPNFIDANRARAAAEAAVRRAQPEPLRARLADLVFRDLVGDRANARPARAPERAAAPSWVQREIRLGRRVHVFVLRRASGRRLARLRELIAALRSAARERDRDHDARADWLVRRCGRMALSDIEIVLGELAADAALRRDARCAREQRPLCAAERVPTPSGGAWLRVVSKAQLGQIGAAMYNCCAPTRAYHRIYAASMAAGRTAFWAYCDPSGVWAGLAQIDLSAGRVVQARGPRNHALDEDADLACLLTHLAIPERVAFAPSIACAAPIRAPAPREGAQGAPPAPEPPREDAQSGRAAALPRRLQSWD
jgi:hypothetical protein